MELLVLVLFDNFPHRFGDLFRPAVEVFVLAASLLIVNVTVDQTFWRHEENSVTTKNDTFTFRNIVLLPLYNSGRLSSSALFTTFTNWFSNINLYGCLHRIMSIISMPK